jgi:hypothetical protein
MRGQSRALTIITAYLIKKYKWSLYKTLEYVNSKRNDFEIRANFLKQLVQPQNARHKEKMHSTSKNKKSVKFDDFAVIINNAAQ